MAGIIIQPPGWPAPSGYSNGVLGTAGEILAIAGQIAWDENRRIVSSDFTAQFERALANVLAVAKAGGARPEHIIQMRIFVTDKKEYRNRVREIGAIWQEQMGRYYPAMSLVQVSDLLEDRAKIEIEALAVLPPRDRTGQPIPEDDSGGEDDQEFDPPTKTYTTDLSPRRDDEDKK